MKKLNQKVLLMGISAALLGSIGCNKNTDNVGPQHPSCNDSKSCLALTNEQLSDAAINTNVGSCHASARGGVNTIYSIWLDGMNADWVIDEVTPGFFVTVDNYNEDSTTILGYNPGSPAQGDYLGAELRDAVTSGDCFFPAPGSNAPYTYTQLMVYADEGKLGSCSIADRGIVTGATSDRRISLKVGADFAKIDSSNNISYSNDATDQSYVNSVEATNDTLVVVYNSGACFPNAPVSNAVIRKANSAAVVANVANRTARQVTSSTQNTHRVTTN